MLVPLSRPVDAHNVVFLLALLGLLAAILASAC